MRAQDFVKDNIAYHKQLSPAAWSGNRLRPEVRERLLAIAGVFVEYLEIPNFEVMDIVLTGSMANYNWTRFSDFDLHVVTDYSDLQCDDLAESLYRAKKKIWNDQHNIRIRGHEVELYVEDVNHPPVSQGMFSLKNNAWLQEPQHMEPEINSGAVNHKVQGLLTQIKHALESANDSRDIQHITDKLRRMRRAGLDTGGEFSVENLAFKIIRNLGYLDQLSQVYHATQDREFSMEGIDDYQVHDTPKLDSILVRLIHMVQRGQHKDPKRYGMVAAAVLDTDNRIVTGINLPGDGDQRIHAERVAINKYHRQYGAIPQGSIIITTLSPCNEYHTHMADERVGSSCTDLINSTDVHKVYAGYADPTQHDHSEQDFTVTVTANKEIQQMCQKLADTFL
jgi:pyrimidine deaminase RibD-like protein/predicted nucleotidyltransferase